MKMNQFQQELQALSLNDYRSGDILYWDQQNQYPYYFIEDAARRYGGCGGCFNYFNGISDTTGTIITYEY
ncbi:MULTISPECIES: heterocycloanthracin/sonorensin family bacteriocin [Bacillus]|uniref:heterocycloanthracin/sonorensin family bacteriocin n=1 Tax=Bacillus TaxID=1386 RepID=UPI0009B5029B|nr:MULTISPECIES: heterocycloanthracin/sonorensin family bacteriocin [Bacillus]MEC0902783.1 heterocycloanthracin/sonorensin family bacteriocin [Bacillus anthracis]